MPFPSSVRAGRRGRERGNSGKRGLAFRRRARERRRGRRGGANGEIGPRLELADGDRVLTAADVHPAAVVSGRGLAALSKFRRTSHTLFTKGPREHPQP